MIVELVSNDNKERVTYHSVMKINIIDNVMYIIVKNRGIFTINIGNYLFFIYN